VGGEGGIWSKISRREDGARCPGTPWKRTVPQEKRKNKEGKTDIGAGGRVREEENDLLSLKVGGSTES